ncbi:MAG: HpcH/HpaI aldolase/citrate lyase family protein [Orrella sp.]
MSTLAGNSFKERLLAGEPQIGLWLSIPSAFTAEICATAGFDWLLLDGEHTPNDIQTVLSQLQAIGAYPISHPIARPVTGDPVLIKQMLDVGVQTLLIPMVDDAEQAAHLVAATRYPPNGFRGVGYGTARVSRWDLRTDYPKVADQEVCLLVQAETKTAIENLDAICAVEGVDGVFLGPSDLAAAYGHLGNPAHPDVQAVIEQGIATILKHGKAPGVLTPDETLAKHYLSLGAKFVAVGLEARVLARGIRELRGRFTT